VRVSRANAEARIAPTREGYVNAIQVWPFTDGALYQVYAAVGRVTVVALAARRGTGDGGRRRYRALDRGRHVQRQRRRLRVNVMVKPIRSGLKTNLVITTSRSTYLLELTSTEKTWMASVSWEYPKDKMLALQRQAQAASAAAPVDSGLSLEKIRFRYAVSGSNPPWKPLRAFDDGEKVYIQFPPASPRRAAAAVRDRRAGRRATGELPLPLAVLHRGSAVWRGRVAPGRGQGRRGADRAHGWRCAEELTMSQDDTPDLATPQAGKVAPEAVALRAQPRPVTRLNRRTWPSSSAACRSPCSAPRSGRCNRTGAVPTSRPSFTTSIACRSPKGWMAAGGLLQAAAEGARAGAAAAGRSRPGHREPRSSRWPHLCAAGP
jgi:P-type conjugative transfer protein TrbG